MNKKRVKFQIVASILEAANGGSIRTIIQHKANLTTAQFDDYLAYLQQDGLLTVLSDKTGKFKSYKTTHKGFAYLSLADSLKAEYSFLNGPARAATQIM